MSTSSFRVMSSTSTGDDANSNNLLHCRRKRQWRAPQHACPSPPQTDADSMKNGSSSNAGTANIKIAQQAVSTVASSKQSESNSCVNENSSRNNIRELSTTITTTTAATTTTTTTTTTPSTPTTTTTTSTATTTDFFLVSTSLTTAAAASRATSSTRMTKWRSHYGRIMLILSILVCLVAPSSYVQAAAPLQPLGDTADYNKRHYEQEQQSKSSTSSWGGKNNRNTSRRPTFLSKLSTHIAFLWDSTTIAGMTHVQYESNRSSTNNNNAATATATRTWYAEDDDIDSDTDTIFDGNIDEDDEYANGLLARVVASTKKSAIEANARLAEQIRTRIEQFVISNSNSAFNNNNNNNTFGGGFDWIGSVSTPSSRHSSCTRRSARATTTMIPSDIIVCRGGSDDGDNNMNGLDLLARGLVLNLGKVVALQSARTWLKARDVDVLQQLADRLLSEESATAVRTIRTMLASMEDHGIIDVFAKYSSQDIAASFYTLYRLQRSANRYQQQQPFLQEGDYNGEEKNQEQQPLLPPLQQHGPPEDLMHVLEDLSHYVVYATAAYGWKMDLAFKGKLHMGNEQALMRKTGVAKEDIVHLSLKAKAHLPVFFLVQDRSRKALVLCVRGTWSARDVLTDLCCTAEEYEAPVSPSSSSSSSSSSSTTIPSQGGKQHPNPKRYCAHHGMLEAAMAVAIEMEDVIQQELDTLGPEWGLVLVGHSMGGGVVSLLATFWENRFNNIKTYLFGGPCVAPLDSHPTNCTNIINVISEGDPFRCLSLGHIADISAAVAHFCEAKDLRRLVLSRADEHLDDMSPSDLKFCFKTMEKLRREVMTNSNKMFPPGRLFHVHRPVRENRPSSDVVFGIDQHWDNEDDLDDLVIHEVGPDFFKEFILSPKMLDISRHLPSLYEDTLRNLLEKEDPQIIDESDEEHGIERQ